MSWMRVTQLPFPLPHAKPIPSPTTSIPQLVHPWLQSAKSAPSGSTQSFRYALYIFEISPTRLTGKFLTPPFTRW